MPIAPKMRPLLTVGEVADALRVEPSTVYRWARDGVVPCVRIAGTVRIPPSALEALTNTVAANSEAAA